MIRDKDFIDWNYLAKRLSPAIFREIVDCVCGNKVTRLDFLKSETEAADKWIKRLGLFSALGNTYYKCKIDSGMETWSSTFYETDKEDAEGEVSIYLSTEKTKAIQARDADEASDHEKLGLLMGFPKCCIKKFLEWSSEHFKSDPIRWLEMSYFQKEIPKFMIPNPFTRYAQGGLISHYPCSLHCKPSYQQAAESQLRVQRYNLSVSNALMERERTLVIYSPDSGVGLLSDFKIEHGNAHYNANKIYGQGEIFIHLKHGNYLSLNQKGEIRISYSNDLINQVEVSNIYALMFTA